MKSLKLFSIAFMFCAWSSANARAQIKIIKPPTTQAEIQRMATLRPVNRVAALPPAEKIKIVQAALNEKVDAAKTKNYSLSLPLKLDVQNSFIEGKGKMIYSLSSEVSAAENRASFDSLAGGFKPYLKLFYNAPAPGFYVFDFTVENQAPPDKTANLNFRHFLFDSQTKSLSKGVQHQVFVSQFADAGWQMMLLQSETSWDFLAVEISEFK